MYNTKKNSSLSWGLNEGKESLKGRIREASWEWRMKVLTGYHRVVTLYFEQENNRE